MVRFLFWNIKNNEPLLADLHRIVESYDVDVVALAECNIGASTLLQAINNGVGRPLYVTDGLARGLTVLTRFSPAFTTKLTDDDNITIRRMNLPGRQEVIFAVVHLPCKLFLQPGSVDFLAVEWIKDVLEAEQRVGHDRTIVMGDFNMNPYDLGMIAAQGLHSVMARSTASGGSRRIKKWTYKFFYNPMWSLMGDLTPGPPGTYYTGSGGSICYFWHTIDHVLLRPSLIGGFDGAEFRIVDTVGGVNLLDKVGKKGYTDHFPIMFGIEF